MPSRLIFALPLLLLMAGISALTTVFVSFLPGRVPRPVMVTASPAPAAGK